MTSKDNMYICEHTIEQFINYYQDNCCDVLNLRILKTFCEEIIDCLNKEMETEDDK